MRIYLASPFFNEDQLARVKAVEEALANNPTVTKVFSPRLAQYDGLRFGTREWREAVFHNNIKNIVLADIVLGIYDYEDKHTDAGTAWEMGASVGLDIPLVVFQEKNYPVNLMMSDSLTAYLKSFEDVAEYDFAVCPKIEFTGDVF